MKEQYCMRILQQTAQKIYIITLFMTENVSGVLIVGND